jgi:hypothetical protein
MSTKLAIIWRGTIVAHADKPKSCIEFNEKYRGEPFLVDWTLRIWNGYQVEQNYPS